MFVRSGVIVLVAVLVAGAGVLELVTGDADAFEQRTGLFAFLGIMVIDAIVLLVGLVAALYAASLVFPRRWGEKAGPIGAILAALIAAFCFRVLWLGGA